MSEACPICGGPLPPRRKTCSEACYRALQARQAGARPKKPGPRIYGLPAFEAPCRECGKVRLIPNGNRAPARCWECRSRALRGRSANAGEQNTFYTSGVQVGKGRWAQARESACTVCGARRRLIQHHVVYVQAVRREKGELWDPRNAMTLCVACHLRHHRRSAPVLAALLSDANLDYAFALLGVAAHPYIHRRYDGDDPRLELRLAWAEEELERLPDPGG